MAVNTEDIVAANQQAKAAIIEALGETLKQDPAADLAAVLEDQARAYALVRSDLDAPLQPLQLETKRSRSLSELSSDSGGSQAPSGSDGEADEWGFVLINSSIRVHRSIDPCILNLVWPDAKQPHEPLLSLPTADGRCEGQFAAGLNAALKQGDMLWTLYETAVVGLSPAVIVKIGSSLDDDGITNLDYVNACSPRSRFQPYWALLCAKAGLMCLWPADAALRWKPSGQASQYQRNVTCKINSIKSSTTFG